MAINVFFFTCLDQVQNRIKEVPLLMLHKSYLCFYC